MSGTNTLPQLTEDEFRAEARKRFGTDPMLWRFKCPCCGHVATANDYKAANAPSNAVGFSCIGRWMDKGAGPLFVRKGEKADCPCNYSGGGLFNFNPQPVLFKDGRVVHMFALAEAQ